MLIQVTLMALLRRPNGLTREFERDVPPDTKIKQFLLDLNYTNQEIRLFQLFVTKSGEETARVSKNYILQNNDVIFITIPVGGG